MPDLNRLLRRVKPSIDAGGRIMLVSRSDKANPESEFKRIYRAAKETVVTEHTGKDGSLRESRPAIR